MSKELVVYDNSGRGLVEDLGFKTVYSQKYGLIRITGESDKRRIDWNTYLGAKKAIESGNNDKVIFIKSLGISVKVGKIATLEEKEELSEEMSNFTKTPTSTVVLGLDFKVKDKNEDYYLGRGEDVILATAHYVERNGERAYLLNDINKIKRMVYLKNGDKKRVEPVVYKVLEYGYEKI